MKGVEKTWIIDKREEVLTVTSREAFSEQYFESRVNKSNRAHAILEQYGPESATFNQQQLREFDQFTKDRKEDYAIIRTKVNLETLTAEIYEKKR